MAKSGTAKSGLTKSGKVKAALLAGAAALGTMMSTAFGEVGGGDRIVGAPFATRAPAVGVNGMAATAHPLATQVALDVLKAGGSAVDAAIAANAALGLMEPVGNGIGGDLFAIVWDPETARLYGLNASGRSPQGRSLDDLRAALGEETSIPSVGSLPVTVPGTVDGWFELHERFGRLSMSEVMAPAVTYAREGHPVTQLIAYYWDRNMSIFEERYEEGPWLEEFDNARQTYLIDGAAPREGQVFRNPDLANTLERIGAEGRDVFYRGDMARTMAAYMERIGGDLTYEDFAAHESEWVEPVSVNYRGYDVFELPPNTQGVAALQMLQILEGFDLASMGPGADALHLMVEAKRLAFEDLARYYADPQFTDIPLDWLISDEYAAERRALIRMDRAMEDVGPGVPPQLEQGDTTYLTVADSNGMMVSLIQSNYRGMGSGLVPDGLGFMFQDRGELFALEDSHANVYAPGKRPFHTIIPAFIMRDGAPLMSFGLMGGDMQPQGHVQVLVNIIDFGMNIQEAGDAARFRHAGSSTATGEPREGVGIVELESGYGPDIRAEMEARGHVPEDGSGGFGGYQAIWRDPETGVYFGATEMRKDGTAMGY